MIKGLEIFNINYHIKTINNYNKNIRNLIINCDYVRF